MGALIKDRKGVRGTVIYLILTGIAFFTICLVPVEELRVFREGASYLLGLSVYLPTIAEAKRFDVLGVISLSGIFIFVMAISGLLLLRDRFVQSLFVVSFALSLLQIRFSDLLSIPLALLASYTICLALEKSEFPVFEKRKDDEQYGRKSKKPKTKVKHKRSVGDRIVVTFFIAVLLSPSVAASIRPLDISEGWREALLWIKSNTEPTSYYLNPESKPEYAIMSWWDYGNWIVYIAKRPVVCNNFQAGAIDAAKFFTAQSEDEAWKIVKKRGVKYIVTDDAMGLNKNGKFVAIMQIAGLDTLNKTEVGSVYNNSMYYKLHIEDAAHLRKFRLIGNFGEVKVFKVIG